MQTEGTIGVDGDKDKDGSRAKSAKVLNGTSNNVWHVKVKCFLVLSHLQANKEEDDKTRTTAANVAVRAATGVGDMLSRWQLMAEAKQKQGGADASTSSQPAKEVGRKPSTTSTRNTKENQEAEKRDPSAAFNTPGKWDSQRAKLVNS